MMPESLFEQVVMGILAVMLLVLAIGFFTVVVTLIADAIIDLIRTVQTKLRERRERQRLERVVEDSMREADRKQGLYANVRAVVEGDQRQRLDMAARTPRR